MTQIVLHPRDVMSYGPYGGSRVNLKPPWMWWETRVYANTAGNLLEIRCEPSAEEVRDYIVTFGDDGDRVQITDPPALFLIQITETEDINYGGAALRSVLTSSFMTARVVWWAKPGARWLAVPEVVSCRPGEYVQDSRVNGRPGARWQRGEPDFPGRLQLDPLPEMQWPMNQMLVDGQLVAAPSLPLTGDRCRQCQAYMPESERGTEVRNWGGDLIAVLQGAYGGIPLCEDCRRMQRGYTRSDVEALRGGFMTPNEIREREGLAPAPSGDTYVEPMTADEYRRLSARRIDILPESDVIDEIDRLVNDQLRPGPVDDYNVNRYPRCDRCPHPWHGLLCDAEECNCLGDLEDAV